MTTLFYNKEGIGDVLIIHLLKDRTSEVKVDRKGDLAVVTDETSQEIVGFNLFNASNYFTLDDVKGKWSPEKIDVDKLNQTLKEAGIDTTLSVDLRPDFLIGWVEKKESHPDADKLNVCQVNVGTETLQIVCGAPNVDENQKVVVARVGAVMPDGNLIKDAELRGVPSSGMICSARELGLPNAPKKKGIYILSEDAPVGESFWDYQTNQS